MKRRHISQTYTGIAMACFSAGYLVAPLLLTTSLYQYCGRRRTAQLALLLLSSSLLLYALAYFIPDRLRFLFGSISAITRTLEGLGTGGSTTGIMSLISKEFPDQRGVALSARGVGGSLGVCLGAVIGTSLFSLVGYFGAFLFLSVHTLLTIFFLFVFHQNRDYQHQNQNTSLGYCDIFRVRRAILVIVSYAQTASVLFSLEPTLALKLSQDFGFSSSKIGLYFSLMCITQVASGLASMMVDQRQDLRPILLFSYLCLFIGPLMVGPSRILDFPNTSQIVAAGLLVAGVGRGFTVSFTVKEAIQTAAKLYSEQQKQVSDKVISLYFVADGLAMMVFPVLGSWLSEQFSFEQSQEIIAMMNLMVFVVFLGSSVYDLRKERSCGKGRRGDSEEAARLL